MIYEKIHALILNFFMHIGILLKESIHNKEISGIFANLL